MSPEWQPRPHPKSKKKARPKLPEPEASPTEMIDRNQFQLDQLQTEIGRLKAELARQRQEMEEGPAEAPQVDPAAILREARAQLEQLKDRLSDDSEDDSGVDPADRELQP